MNLLSRSWLQSSWIQFFFITSTEFGTLAKFQSCFWRRCRGLLNYFNKAISLLLRISTNFIFCLIFFFDLLFQWFIIYFVSCSATKVFCYLCEVEEVQENCFLILRSRIPQRQIGELSGCLTLFLRHLDRDTQAQHHMNLNRYHLLNLT